MQHSPDRRVSGVTRVPVERIVDVCASAAQAPAFQGRSSNVSGRGMSVRSSYLPELDTPIVIRFQEQGAEVIAEGEVAWRQQTASGGEFGVRFTALDSRSVQALKALCKHDADAVRSGASTEEAEDSDQDTEPAPAAVTVKLHIDGLATPMQAQIREQSSRRLAVGSPLEFLRVGRSLEVEDLALGKRRGARIDGIDVSVDEDSRVPELIVSVRYSDVPDTPLPAPSHARRAGALSVRRDASTEIRELPRVAAREVPRTDGDAEASPPPPRSQAPAPRTPAPPARALAPSEDERFEEEYHAALHDPGAESTSDRSALESEEEDAEEQWSDGAPRDVRSEREPPLGSPTPAEVASAADGRASGGFEDEDAASEAERLRERMDGVLNGMSLAASVAGRHCRSLGGVASRSANWLVSRARGATRQVAARHPPTPRRRTAAAPRTGPRSTLPRQNPRLAPGGARPVPEAGAGRRGPRWAALGAVLVVSAAVGTWLGRAAPPEAGAAPSGSAVPAQAAAPESAPPAPGAVPQPEPNAPPPPSERSRILLPAEAGDVDDFDEPSGVVAQVPLFGPTSLSQGDSRGAGSAPIEKRALARVKVADQTFADAPVAQRRAKPTAVTEFGSGRLRLPIVYRLRLDQPGESLRGERTPTGFDVIIPGRKVMESGSAISRRDDRIAKVATKNGSDATRVSFRFKDAIPAYKVRLRKDYVEFFISSK